MSRSMMPILLVCVLLFLSAWTNAADKPSLAKVIVDQESIVGELMERTDKHVRILDVRTNALRTLSVDEIKSIRVDIPEREAALSVGLPKYVAWNIRRNTPSTGVNTVVVLPLCNASGQPTIEGKEFAETLTTELVRNDVRVVERALLHQVLGELARQDSRGFDSATAQRIGKQLGGFVVLTGTIVKRRKVYVAELRLIKVETGEILFATTHGMPHIIREPEVVKNIAWQKPQQPTQRPKNVVVVKPKPVKKSKPGEKPKSVDLWTSGQGGYEIYRFPSLIRTVSGTLLAFCGGEKKGPGSTTLLLRRSTDGGQTWSPAQVIWHDEGNTCCSPCPVIEKETGTILLLATHTLGGDHYGKIITQTSKGTSTVWLLKSTDDGKTWSKPREITEKTKKPTWTWYSTGPGAGIQIKRGQHKGRLLIPCGHVEVGTKRCGSHIVFSDDYGETWRLGGSAPQHNVIGCEVVELANPPGRLMLNTENSNRSNLTRQTALSDGGGLTWHSQKHDSVLIEPPCQASFRRLQWPADGQPGMILFSNPASRARREKMTVRVSYDDAKTWAHSKLVDNGFSAYSCLTAIDDETAGLAYEGAVDGRKYRRITFVRLNLKWLTADLN